MKDVRLFIKEIKKSIEMKNSKWHKRKVHYMGSTILTNNEMKTMLSIYYDWFDNLESNEKRKIADYVFDKLRE